MLKTECGVPTLAEHDVLLEGHNMAGGVFGTWRRACHSLTVARSMSLFGKPSGPGHPSSYSLLVRLNEKRVCDGTRMWLLVVDRGGPGELTPCRPATITMNTGRVHVNCYRSCHLRKLIPSNAFVSLPLQNAMGVMGIR